MGNLQLSIIVPIYNAEKYLQKCIDSLLRQGLKNYELLLVNDGSTDSSLSICQSYAAQYEHIKILNQSNSGVCAARNYGMRCASGEWIVLIDADDYLLDNGLKTVLTSVGNLSSYDVIQYKSSYDFWEKLPLSTEVTFKGDGHELIRQSGFVSFCWLCFYRNEFLQKNHIIFNDKYIVGEDQLFVANVFLHNPRTAVVATDIYRYVVHENSATTKRDVMHTRRCVNDYLASYHDIMLLTKRLATDEDTQTAMRNALEGKKMFGFSRILSADYDYHSFCNIRKLAFQYQFFPMRCLNGSLKNRLITRLMNLAVRYYIFYKPASWLFNGIISNYILPKLRLKLKDGK